MARHGEQAGGAGALNIAHEAAAVAKQRLASQQATASGEEAASVSGTHAAAEASVTDTREPTPPSLPEAAVQAASSLEAIRGMLQASGVNFQEKTQPLPPSPSSQIGIKQSPVKPASHSRHATTVPESHHSQQCAELGDTDCPPPIALPVNDEEAASSVREMIGQLTTLKAALGLRNVDLQCAHAAYARKAELIKAGQNGTSLAHPQWELQKRLAEQAAAVASHSSVRKAITGGAEVDTNNIRTAAQQLPPPAREGVIVHIKRRKKQPAVLQLPTPVSMVKRQKWWPRTEAAAAEACSQSCSDPEPSVSGAEDALLKAIGLAFVPLQCSLRAAESLERGFNSLLAHFGSTSFQCQIAKRARKMLEEFESAIAGAAGLTIGVGVGVWKILSYVAGRP